MRMLKVSFFYLLMRFCSFLVYEEAEDPNSRSFFSEIIASVSDIKFSHNGRYLLTRDYLTVKVNSVFFLFKYVYRSGI